MQFFTVEVLVVVTNLPAEAKAKWVKVMEAKNPQEKLIALQEFLSAIPKHKGTEKLVQQVKRQISQLRREIEEEKKRRVGRGPRFFIEKCGAAQVVVLGMPNSGKSSLLAALTNARVEVSEYPYTTRLPVPGMLNFEDIQFQIVEAPAIMKGASEGVAWGLKSIGLARNADGLILLVDLTEDPISQFETIIGELGKARIIVEKPKGRVVIEKRSTGGVQVVIGGKLVGATVDDVKALLRSYKILNALVKIYGEASLDDVEDSIFENTVYKPVLVLATKADFPGWKEVFEELKSKIKIKAPVIPVSTKSRLGLELVGREIFKMLDIVRVYTKQPNQEKPSEKPLVVKRGTTVLEAARIIHSSLYKNFKYAKIWGSSAKYPGQRVGGDHVLEDGDILEIHTF